jgi:2-haloalkanoic acid dehalogenase type II
MKMPKWIAFDMYTTLLSREAGAIPVMETIIRSTGGAANADTVFNDWHHAIIREYRTRFISWKEAGRRVMPLVGAKHKLDLRPDHADQIFASISTWPAHPDVEPVLSKLKRHAKIGVVTNMDTDLFRASKLPVELDDAVTSEMAGAYKPNPAIFDLALKRFGVSPDEILWVGTAIWADVVGARLAGLPVVWIKRPMGYSVGAMDLAAWDPVPDHQFVGLEPLLNLLSIN